MIDPGFPEVPITDDPEKKRIIAFAYENMVLFQRPHVYLWLSDDWERCHEVQAVPLDPETREIGLYLTTWRRGGIVPDFHRN